MMNKPLHKVIFIAFLFTCSNSLFSQDTISVKSTIDRNSILIGERIRLTYEADIPETKPIRFFSIDTIDHFEFIDKGKIDTTNTSYGTRLRQVFLITSFDSGQWVIPSYALDAQSVLRSDSFIINVGFTPFDTSQAYHDIKEIIEVEPEGEKAKKHWFNIISVILLVLIVVIYILTRKKKKKPVPIVTVDPYDEAMGQLEALRKNRDLSSKEYYTRLSDIFRNYLAKRKNISSLQKTTDELVILLQSLNLPAEQNRELAQVLRITDFVKFAKYEPSKEDDQSSFDTIKNIIMIIEKLPA